MPIHFRIDTKEKCVHATGEEPLSDADLLKYQMGLADHPDHGQGFDQLLDMRSIDGMHVTAFGVREAGRLSDTFAEHLLGTRCAVVAEAAVGFGLARMFASVSSDAVDVQVFRKMHEAREWLGLP